MNNLFEEYIEKYEEQYREVGNLGREFFKKNSPSLPEEKSQVLPNHTPWTQASYWTMLPEHCLRGSEDDIFVKIHSRILAGRKNGRPHNHRFFEMVYVYRGECSHEMDGRQVIQPEQSIVLMNPEAKHFPMTQSPDDVVFNILFMPKIIGNTFVQLLEGNSVITRFFLDSLYGIRQDKNYLFFRLPVSLCRLIQQIIMEWYDQERMCRQLITADVLRLFAQLSCFYHEQNISLPTRHKQGQDMAYTVILYMKQNYATVSIRELSDQFQYSQSAISHLLKRTYQKTFSELITEFKIENACIYLKSSPMSSDQIAEIIGYNDSSYFHKVFKKKMGISPSQYRKKYNIFNEK